MELRFDGRVVLVTGASRGIGAALARGFGAAGATVAVHYGKSTASAREVLGDIEAAGGKGFCVQADVVSPDGPDELVAAVLANAGRLDVLVNNVGALRQRMLLAETDDQTYEELVAANLSSVFRACRAAIPELAKVAPASIVNLSSLSARDGGGGGNVIYAAVKAAVSTFTRGLAKELATSGIRVNALAPGLIDTPLHQRTPEAVMKRLTEATPMKRIGLPEECVGPVLFLASETAASYVTGQSLEVNGGRMMP
jgi:3-oxoacyl-[acyl-carrier protein] reductase